MEATSARQMHRPPGAAPESAGKGFVDGLADPVRGVLTEAGQFAVFSARALVASPQTWRYASEVIRQAGLWITGSALVIFAMEFVIGLECGTEANYVLRGYGATTYAGVFTALCAAREMTPMMFGYIVAAKVGCGLVAEIGSMRINEEIDAMESIGLNPMRYLVATRVVAAWLVLPIFYWVGLNFTFLGEYVVMIPQIGEVSQGGWETVHWAFNNLPDLTFGMIKVIVFGTTIVLTGTYFGYTASGGPVGVGKATARSMIVNLVLLHLLNTIMSSIFWGFNPRMPIGG